MESALLELAREGAPGDEVSVIARLKRDGRVPPALRVIARFDLIVTGRIARRDIETTRCLVASMKRPQFYAPTLDFADEEDWTGEDWAEAAADDLLPRPGDRRRAPGLPTGAGVVVAHLDWGLDFTHPAFRHADGRTRVLALWDQGATYDPRHPNRYGFGRIHHREDIDRALGAADPFAALGYRWWTSDRGAGSHGTHTLGISAGGGLDGGEPGMAPEADIVFVDLTTRTPEGAKPLGDSSDLIEGVDFAIRCARERPLVINASLGRQAGEKDGLTLTEQALDAMLAERPGRAMTMSCGNYYAKGCHARVTLDPGELHRFALDLAPGNRRSEIDLWYPRADRIALSVTGPAGAAAGPVHADGEAEIRCEGRVVGRVHNRRDDPNNGDSQGSVFLHGDAPPGRWELAVHGDAVGDGRLNAWVERDPAGAGRLRFAATDADPELTIGTICCGYRTIAIAAYDAHDPVRAPGRFSSAGPTRDGRNNRPGCAAPGVQVISARSTPRDRRPAPRQSRMSGTSMAAPFAAGVIALMFAAARRPLAIAETREALIGSVEPVPEEQRLRFGAGYCAPAAAVARATALAAAPPPPSDAAGAQRLFRTSIDGEDVMENASDGAEMFDGPPEGCDADFASEFLDADAMAEWAAWESADAEARRGWGGPPPLPFQFQIPIGGSGGFGIGVPIGGRASPFALSIPLGGALPPPAPATQVVVNQPVAPAAGRAPDDPGIVTALDLPPDPVAAATGAAADAGELMEAEDEGCCPDCDAQEDELALAEAASIDALERSYQRQDFSEVDARYAGEQVMAGVEALAEGFGSSADMLADLGEALGDAEADATPVSLAELFRRIAGGEAAPRLFGRAARVLLRPGDALGGVEPLRGDILLRAVPGQGWAQLSFVATDGLVPGARAVALGLRPEADPALLSGRFAHVIELWPVRRREDARFARRLVNAADLVAHDTALLRLVPPGGAVEAEHWAEEDAPAPLAPGAHGAAVAELQRRLNALHAARTAAGLGGFGDLPLMEDGRYGPRLRAAVTALQRLAPAGLIARIDGIVDAATWNALALLEAAVPLVRRPAAPAPHVGGNTIAAGQLIEEHLPLLAGHRGTAPDLVLRWNAMPAATERVDVVVHLHGFSGRGQAMRIDRDKLPASGLDFADPHDPSRIGRAVPTLAILPRGNFYGGRTGMGYDFPALLAPVALDQLIAQSLERFARAAGLGRIAMGRLILTAHSGGGAPLMRLLAHHDPDEVHCFDALYNPPASLIRWATAKLGGSGASAGALRVLYRAGEGTAAHSRQVADALAPLTRSDPALARRWRVEAVREPHNGIPGRYGWRLLADAGADLTGSAAAPAVHEYEDGDDGDWHAADAEARLTDDAEDDPPAPGLDQATLDRLAAATFGNAAELQAHFAGAGGFQDWFNATLSGHAPFRRPGRGGALHMPTTPVERQRFADFWDRVQLGYDQPRISLLEFAALIAIIMNETDGRFGNQAERGGSATGGHPGIAYFFDRIGRKASYNAGNSLGNRTAGDLFDDPLFIRAHGHLGGAAQFAHQGSALNGAWHGQAWPAGVPSGMTDPAIAFIREADFCKFRGRGIIQTTGRESYRRHVHYVRTYAGGDAAVLALQTAWRAFPNEDDVCTASSNADWDAWFARPDTLVLGLRLHASRLRYHHMARTAALLNETVTRRHAPPGAIATMGLRISGSAAYGNGLYRNRVLGLMTAMAGLLGAGVAPAPAQAPSVPAAPRDGRETEHPTPAPVTPHAAPRSTRRSPVAAPDAETARAQWAANRRAHGYFGNSLDTYLSFVPAFAQRGVGDAAGYLADNMVGLRFLGRRQDGHRDLVEPLRAAEAALAGRTLVPPLSSFGCLNVRFIANTHRLSFHGLGRAIDLSWRENPHVKAAEDFLVIQAVTGTNLHRETSPGRLRELSEHFQRDFTPAWVAAQTDAAVRHALADRRTRGRLEGYARTGFFTLDLALVEALLAAGLRWGGSWPTTKDFMHFELA